ncbi:MAG: hypothetical protein ACE5H4_05655 [Candidatus Thorarchaeota archaeon]
MELAAIRGRNQKGISYAHASVDSLANLVASLKYGGRVVYTDVRPSDKVPVDSIVVDSRLFDELDCVETDLLEIDVILESIPLCSEILLAIGSIDRSVNRKVVEAVSKRIDDFEEHLHGLILTAGQTIKIPGLKLRLVVQDLHPVSEATGAAKISWKHLLKVKLDIEREQQSCHNLCVLFDVGASSKKSDVTHDGEIESFTPSRTERGMTRLEAARLVIEDVLAKSKECDSSLLAALAYGEKVSELSILDSESESETGHHQFSSKSSEALDNWLSEQFDEHNMEPSNPAAGLQAALKVASELAATNRLPTVLLFLSGGAYSEGQNPVSVVRELARAENVTMVCVSLGEDSDIDLLRAIAEAAQGKFLEINDARNAVRVQAELSKWVRSVVIDNGRRD